MNIFEDVWTQITNYVFTDLVPVTVKGNKKKGRGSLTDQDSIKTEDIEKEYRKVLVQPGSNIPKFRIDDIFFYLWRVTDERDGTDHTPLGVEYKCHLNISFLRAVCNAFNL